MATPRLSREKCELTVNTYIACEGPRRTWTAAAKACGYKSEEGLQRALETATELYGIRVPEREYTRMTTLEKNRVEARLRGEIDVEPSPTGDRNFDERQIIVAPLPDKNLPIEDIIEHRKREFAAKQAYEKARALRQVKVKIEGPIGLLHFGDPHVDDDGTNIELLERHSDLTRKEEGVFGCNVGDTTNNWVGRLSRLYAQQNMGREMAIKVAEWFIKRTRWLYMIGGNHDAWSGDDDPIKWIVKGSPTMYQESNVRVALNFPNGRQVRINARHDFPGSSQWNPAHGPMKALFHGVRDHLAVCGHRHESGYGIVKDPETGIAMHAIKVASYKVYDRFAMERAFRDQHLGPAAFTILDPYMPEDHPDLVKLFWNPEEGIDYLRYKRSKFKRTK